MAADTPLGQPYEALIRFVDANGSPHTGAPGGGGLMTITQLTDAASVVAGPTTVSDFGDGWYGLALNSTVLLAPGLYKASIPTITLNGRVYTNQAMVFTVGDVPPEYLTLRGLIVAVARALGVGVTGTSTTLGTTATLIDTRWLDPGLATNEFVGDELLILEP